MLKYLQVDIEVESSDRQSLCLCCRYLTLLIDHTCRSLDHGVTVILSLSSKTWSDSESRVSLEVLSVVLRSLKWVDVCNGSNTVTASSGVTHHLINVCSHYGGYGGFMACETCICQEFIVCFPMNFNLSHSTKESVSTKPPPPFEAGLAPCENTCWCTVELTTYCVAYMNTIFHVGCMWCW